MNFLSKAFSLGGFLQATVTYPPNMSSNTVPSPYVAAASQNNANAYLAFDSSNTTGWQAAAEFTPGDWLSIDLSTPKSITSYTITTTNDAAQNMAAPKSFILEGSANNLAWTAVDAQPNVTWGAGQTTQTFTLGAPSVAYRYFRIYLLESSIPGTP